MELNSKEEIGVKFPNSYKEVREQFVKLIERLAEGSGLNPLTGKIMAQFYLSPQQSMTQKEIAKIIGKSQSTVSRLLDPMVEVGTIRRSGSGGRDGYLYKLPPGGIEDLFKNALIALYVRSIRFQKAIVWEDSALERLIEKSKANKDKDIKEMEQLRKIMRDWIKTAERSGKAIQIAIKFLEGTEEE